MSTINNLKMRCTPIDVGANMWGDTYFENLIINEAIAPYKALVSDDFGYGGYRVIPAKITNITSGVERIVDIGQRFSDVDGVLTVVLTNRVWDLYRPDVTVPDVFELSVVATDTNLVACRSLGDSPPISERGGISIGSAAKSVGYIDIVIGEGAQIVTGEPMSSNSIVIGAGARLAPSDAGAEDSVVVGGNAAAGARYSTTVGAAALGTARYGVAIGRGARAPYVPGSVTVGAHSTFGDVTFGHKIVVPYIFRNVQANVLSAMLNCEMGSYDITDLRLGDDGVRVRAEVTIVGASRAYNVHALDYILLNDGVVPNSVQHKLILSTSSSLITSLTVDSTTGCILLLSNEGSVKGGVRFEMMPL